MLRGVVFVDHLNFDIALRSLYADEEDGMPPKLDYNTLFKGIVHLKEDVDYLKTYIFAPAPDDFLMKDQRYAKQYKWLSGLKSIKYLDIVFGRYIARPIFSSQRMDINDASTFYKIEKGTDINLAVQALSKAYFDSYDAAFVISADSDYIPIYKQLKVMGKLVILVAVQGQRIGKLTPEVDDFIFLDKDFINNHIRKEKIDNVVPEKVKA